MKRNPLSWCSDHAEDFIDLGILFAIGLVLATVLMSAFLKAVNPPAADPRHPPISQSMAFHHRGPQTF
ncbi:MAG: hypothetical protein JWQ52_2125 [Phenylobacterium sp.]|jgi:hypothetical protein|nr:hypothetical protein [Phenylobacterium sp.]